MPDNTPLTEEEKNYLISAGWRFLNEEYIYLPDDYDGCMAYGISNIRRVLRGWQAARAFEQEKF